MDEEKLCRAVDCLRSVLTREIRAPIEKFELSDIGQHHYRLSFEMNGADKVFPMAEFIWKESPTEMKESKRR